MHIRELDKDKLVNKLLLGPLLANHVDVELKTVYKSYIEVSADDLEGQFVQDLFMLKRQEIIDKWYGGMEEAAEILFKFRNNVTN